MAQNPALETALRQLKLPAFGQHDGRLADEAAAANLSYDRYLQALAEQEVSQRDLARQRRCLQQAGFPVLKELADFDWSAIPSLNRARVLELAQGAYLERAETVLLVGNPGLGKTHIATALGVTAARQGQRVRFYTAAGLTAELIQAQSEHRLAKALAQVLSRRARANVIPTTVAFAPAKLAGSPAFARASTVRR